MIRPYYSKKLKTMTYNVDNEWRIPDRLRPSARLLGGEDRVKGATFTVKADAESYNALLAAIAESDCDLSGAVWERAGVSWQCSICGSPEVYTIQVRNTGEYGGEQVIRQNEYRRLCILAGGNPGAGGKPQKWGFCRSCWERHCRICGVSEPTAIAV